MDSGGCPPVPSKNIADPPTSMAPYGIKKLNLFVRDTDAADDMTNRNSADSKAMVLDAIYSATRAYNCAGGLMQEDSCQNQLPQSIFAGTFAGRVVTSVVVEVNTFFGQFGACKKDSDDNAWHCEADWECWCDHWDGGNGKGNPNPCLQPDDDGDPCMCDIWGGCGGGHWDGCPDDGCPAVADNALAVGRHSLADAVASRLSAGQTSVAGTAALQTLAKGAHEFSTTAGGRCSEDEEAKDSVNSFLGKDDSPFKNVCTWSPESPSYTWRSANADCLETVMLTAAETAAADCLALADDAAVRGSPGWIDCVASDLAVRAAEDGLANAFDREACGTANAV